MKRSLKNLKDYSIETIDGKKGKIKDFLFDESRWIIRYIDADFGTLLKEKRILIPRVFLGEPDWENKNFQIKLKSEDINNCPDIDDNKPVSRLYEEQLHLHYATDYYWTYPQTMPMGHVDVFPVRPLNIPQPQMEEKEVETNLRSFREIKDYEISATDDKLGHVEDLILDDIDWQLVYLIVDTSNWKPWSKKVMISLNWIENISYTNMKVDVGIHAETIKDAPELKQEHPIETAYEKALFDYYYDTVIK